MSYKERTWAGGVEYRPYIYLELPHKCSTAHSIETYDRIAANNIKRLEEIIADLTEYRQDLAARYAELEVMPYKRKLELKRHKSSTENRVYYYIKLLRLYEDGTVQEELSEVYTGKERQIALNRFVELGKANPGIDWIKDIEPAKWERR